MAAQHAQQQRNGGAAHIATPHACDALMHDQQRSSLPTALRQIHWLHASGERSRDRQQRRRRQTPHSVMNARPSASKTLHFAPGPLKWNIQRHRSVRRRRRRRWEVEQERPPVAAEDKLRSRCRDDAHDCEVDT